MPQDQVKWFLESLSERRDPAVGENARHALANALERRAMVAGQVLYKQGATPSAVWCIRTGQVELVTRVGRRRSVVQVLRAGSLAGDVPILLESRSLVTAKARRSGSALVIPRESVRSLVTQAPDLGRVWMQSLARRLELARARILQLLAADLSHSLARLILDEASHGEVELTQAAMAEMLGVQRSSVNRVLGAMRRQGLVHVAYGRVSIADAKRLEAQALAIPTALG